MRIKMLSNTR